MDNQSYKPKTIAVRHIHTLNGNSLAADGAETNVATQAVAEKDRPWVIVAVQGEVALVCPLLSRGGPGRVMVPHKHMGNRNGNSPATSYIDVRQVVAVSTTDLGADCGYRGEVYYKFYQAKVATEVTEAVSAFTVDHAA